MNESYLEMLPLALALFVLVALVALGGFYIHMLRVDRVRRIVRSFLKTEFGAEGVVRLVPVPGGREYRTLRRAIKQTANGLEEVWFMVAADDGAELFVGLDAQAQSIMVEGYGVIGWNEKVVRVARYEKGEGRVLVSPFVYDIKAKEVKLRPDRV